MKVNKIDTKKITTKFSNALDTAKKSLTKANNYALSTTEEVVTDTITITNQWQKVTEKALKGSVNLLDNQQKLIFDSLETHKKHFLKGKERFRKVFA